MDSCKTGKKSKACSDSSKFVSSKATLLLSEDFNNLMDSDVLTDFVLKCDREEIRVHKCILAARSPVFAAMFRNDMNEAQSNSVDITDIDSEILREVVRYIYSGQIDNFTDAVAEDLLYAADKYQLDLLKEICIENMKRTLSMDNVIDVLVIGELHDQNLKDHVMDWICKYPVFSELKKMDKWKMLEKSYPRLAIELVTTVVEYLQDFKSLTYGGIQPVAVPPVAYRYTDVRYPQQFIPQTYHNALAQQQSAINQHRFPFYLNVHNPLLRPPIFQQAPQYAHSVTRPQAAQSMTQPVQSVTQPQAAQSVSRPRAAKFVTQPHTSQYGTQPQAAKSVTPPQKVAQEAAVHVEGQEPLTASMLANASAEEQRQMIGERLFPVIHWIQPYRAGKITGMLLEFDNNELLNMLEHHELLKSKVEEAVTLLNEADKEQVNQKKNSSKKSKKGNSRISTEMISS